MYPIIFWLHSYAGTVLNTEYELYHLIYTVRRERSCVIAPFALSHSVGNTLKLLRLANFYSEHQTFLVYSVSNCLSFEWTWNEPICWVLFTHYLGWLQSLQWCQMKPRNSQLGLPVVSSRVRINRLLQVTFCEEKASDNEGSLMLRTLSHPCRANYDAWIVWRNFCLSVAFWTPTWNSPVFFCSLLL